MIVIRNPDDIFKNPDDIFKKPNPVIRPTNGGADAQYTTPHVPSSIPPPPQPTDGDVVYEQVF